MTSEKDRYEKTVGELEEIVRKLSDPDINIDEAIRLHREGLVRYGVCEEILAQAREKIEIYRNGQ